MTDTDLHVLVSRVANERMAPTSSYMAHPIMFAAMMTGLVRSVFASICHSGDVPGDRVNGACKTVSNEYHGQHNAKIETYLFAHHPLPPSSAPSSAVSRTPPSALSHPSAHRTTHRTHLGVFLHFDLTLCVLFRLW
jgi:hypothetical protein